MQLKIVKLPTDEAEEVIPGLHDLCWPSRMDSYWDADAEWWVANEPEGGSVAFGGLRVSKLENGAYLCRGGVAPAFRGQGLQRRLIKAREQYARRQGLRHLITNTVYGNHWSANNLIAEGFRMYNPIAPWGDDDDNYWWKDLR